MMEDSNPKGEPTADAKDLHAYRDSSANMYLFM